MLSETVPLSSLRFGHDHPSFGLNSRITGREADAALVENIKAEGVLSPLLVWVDPDLDGDALWTIDGNRRLDGMSKAGFKPTQPVEIKRYTGDRVQALKVSLATHLFVAPLNPIDRFETFNRLAAEGISEKEIATAFALKPKDVRRTLALGSLDPIIIAAWRAGSIDEATAQAFTLETDKARQVAVAKALGLGKRGIWRHMVVAEIAGKGRDCTAFVNYLGKKAAKAGGVEILEDLFNNTELVRNPDRLAELVSEKLHKDHVEPLLEAGWDFVLLDSEVQQDWRWPVPDAPLSAEDKKAIAQLNKDADADKIAYDEAETKIEAIEDAAWARLSPAERKNFGVFVNLDHEGKVTPEYRKRPTDSKATMVEAADSLAGNRATGSKAKPKDKPPYPKAVITAIREGQTEALTTALKADETGALVLLIATLMAKEDSGSPLCFKVNGADDLRGKGTLANAIEAVQAMSTVDRLKKLAELVAVAIDCNITAQVGFGWNHKRVTPQSIDLAAAAVNQADYLAKLRATFDVNAFFAGAPKKLALEALVELLGDTDAKIFTKGSKDEIAAAAAKHAKDRGWLPEVLRTDTYREAMGVKVKTKAPAKPKGVAKKVAPKAAAKKKAKGS